MKKTLTNNQTIRYNVRKQELLMMEKKQEILQAANECFLQYGYSKTSMNDIGKKVHLNKASLYYHYKDKFTLYKEVVYMHRSKYLFALETLLEKEKNAYDQILLFIKEEIRFSQKTSVILTKGNNNGADVKMETKDVYYEIIEEDIQRLEKMIQKGIEQKAFIPCEVRKVATAIMTVTDAILNVNCPLNVEDNQRETIYIQVQEELNDIIKLMMNGIIPKNSN